MSGVNGIALLFWLGVASIAHGVSGSVAAGVVLIVGALIGAVAGSP